VELLALTAMPYERQQARVQAGYWVRRASFWWMGQMDPRRGQPIRLADYGMKASGMKPAGVIAIDNCEGCSLRIVHDFAARLRGEGVSELHAFSGKPIRAQAVAAMISDCQREGVRADFTWDRVGALRRLLNPYFLPRAYRLGTEGRLVWAQDAGEPMRPIAKRGGRG
jgi:hypothetical protein